MTIAYMIWHALITLILMGANITLYLIAHGKTLKGMLSVNDVLVRKSL